MITILGCAAFASIIIAWGWCFFAALLGAREIARDCARSSEVQR